MKKLVPFLLVGLLAACSKSADKPNNNTTTTKNPNVTIASSVEVGSVGSGFSTSFNIMIDLTSSKSIAYINLIDETDPIEAEPLVKPDKSGPWTMFDHKHPYAGNTDTYHLFVKLTDSTSFNTPQYKCH